MRIHLIAPAGSCRDFFPKIGVVSASELIALVQTLVGPGYRVTGNEAIIEAVEDAEHGGRTDDTARAADIQEALADCDVAAVIMLRGGAWFTRILPRIDFSVLDRRATRVALFAFSELTPLVNIVASHRNGIGIYGMGPVFLGYGLKRFAASRATRGFYEGRTPSEWMPTRLADHFRDYFGRCLETIEGRGRPISIAARCVRGQTPDRFEAALVGGNLTVLSVMVGSRYAESVDPRGKWILLEDYNDKPERFDRYLSHLTLAGVWDRCAGVLLGDFHQDDRDLTPVMIATLERHLPCGCLAPVLVTTEVGHTWPMTPAPLHQTAIVLKTGDGAYAFTWSAERLAVVGGGQPAAL